VPPEAGNLTVLKSEQISTAQKVAKLVRRLPVVLFILLALLYGGAIYLAGNRRREALRSVGFGFVIAGVLALLVRAVAGNAITGSLAATAAVEPAAEAAWGVGTSLLVTVAWSAIAFGLLLVLGAWLAGPTIQARALRREASPYFRERRGAAYAFAAGIWVLLIAWAPIAAFRRPLGILVFAGLFALGTELLRRQTLTEFPDVELRPLSMRMAKSVSSRSADPGGPERAGSGRSRPSGSNRAPQQAASGRSLDRRRVRAGEEEGPGRPLNWQGIPTYWPGSATVWVARVRARSGLTKGKDGERNHR
jgi:hypothetical protein